MKNLRLKIIDKFICIMILSIVFTLPYSNLEAADDTIFDVSIVDSNGAPHDIYDWGDIPWADIANGTAPPWQTPDYNGNGLAIKIVWVSDPADNPAVGIQIYTDNWNGARPFRYRGRLDNPSGLVRAQLPGAKNFIPLCWRVLTHFPYVSQRMVYERVVDELNIEYSLGMNVNGNWNPPWIEPNVEYDMNGDGIIGEYHILSDRPNAYLELLEPPGWNPPPEGYPNGQIPPRRVGYYACYLWMIDKRKGDSGLTPMEEEPYRDSDGNPINACYATVRAIPRVGYPNDVDGIQHAEHDFGWGSNIIYVILGANFGKASSIGTYGSNTITVELYAL